MKEEIVKAVTCFCVLLACCLMWARALADGDSDWALVFCGLGIWASSMMTCAVIRALRAAHIPRRSRRLSADGWWQVLRNVNRKGSEK